MLGLKEKECDYSLFALEHVLHSLVTIIFGLLRSVRSVLASLLTTQSHPMKLSFGTPWMIMKSTRTVCMGSL